MHSRVLGTALLLLSATAAFGQSRFDIPFNFRVGDRNLSAGTYIVSGGGALTPARLTGGAGQAIVVLPQSSVQKMSNPSTGALVFRRYNNVYYLSQIWRRGSSEGSQLPMSRSEREVARAVSQQASTVSASLR